MTQRYPIRHDSSMARQGPDGLSFATHGYRSGAPPEGSAWGAPGLDRTPGESPPPLAFVTHPQEARSGRECIDAPPSVG